MISPLNNVNQSMVGVGHTSAALRILNNPGLMLIHLEPRTDRDSSQEDAQSDTETAVIEILSNFGVNTQLPALRRILRGFAPEEHSAI